MSGAVSPFSQAHRRYVQHLYRRALKGSLNWYIRHDEWRIKALHIRAMFEQNRQVRDPRAVAKLLAEAEKEVAKWDHPDPYIVPSFPGGTKWERNLPPRIFSEKEKQEALAHMDNL
ncbi:hypothetical protein BT69DRAFT_1357063 [Atractiella rhizophila]|nr:hypothetical protein BT69DRAFT_1357063 [Atractiella rhizophila]